MSGAPKGGPRKRAVAYIGMSSEMAWASAVRQMEVIREFARRRGIVIVREYREGSEGNSSAGGPVLR